MSNRNILISGAGIAGTSLAFWLKKFGFNPTVIEISPRVREGGYAIDFMGAGFDVAEKMGIVSELEKVEINISKLSLVDENDNEKGIMNYAKIKKLMNNRALTLLRSDLAKVIYSNLDKGTEVIFGDTISNIAQDNEKVMVTFESGVIRKFDLLVGADGLHSNVRNLVFGEDSQFEKYFGFYTASFTIEDFPYKGRAFSMYNVPNKQVAIYTSSENKTTTFFIFASPERQKFEPHESEKQKQILISEFMDIGWKCKELLSGIETTKEFYFDSVSQVKMENWSNGRITLVGDACDCPSLLSGKGSTLAMVGSYILAGELKEADGDYRIAFDRYEKILKPFMDKKQKSAQVFAKSFVPKSNFGIWIRNKVFRLISLPIISKFALDQFKDKGLRLKEY